MRLVIYAIIVLIAGTWLAVYASKDPGYVMISYRGLDIQTSVNMAVIMLLLAFAVFYAILRLLITTGLLPRRLGKWRKIKKEVKAEKELTKGLIDLNMGKWDAAEKHLRKTSKSAHLATIGYMAAAQAAQGQGDTARRDGYLQLAQDGSKTKTKLAVALNKAHLLAQAGHADEAVATLNKLPPNQLQNPAVLAQQAQLYTQLKDWPSLTNLLPKLRKGKAMPMVEYYELEHTAYSGQLNHVGRSKDVVALEQLWKRLPRRLREKEDMVIDYACSLMNCGHNDDAEEVLYHRINRHWSEALVYIYGLLDGDAEIYLARAKNWLKKHGEDPVLLLTLGKLAVRAHQFEDARNYLEQSLTITPNSETYQELGNLMVYLKEPDQAIACFRHSLAMTPESFAQPQLGDTRVEHARLPQPKPPVIVEAATPQLVEAQTSVEHKEVAEGHPH